MTKPASNSNVAIAIADAAGFGATSGRLVADGHVLPLRVYYEDTDVSGFVYYANYLKFIERGRTDFLRLVGVDHSTLWRDHQLALTVRSCEIEYLSPARLDDEIQIHTRLTDLRGASLIAEQIVSATKPTWRGAGFESPASTAPAGPLVCHRQLGIN